MAAHKIIFVSQEISPYLSVTDFARWGRSLPQSIQQQNYEVRTFMPDFGDINERRNQLHEVIRLSGMNIVIGDNDHPLIVKVASMQPSRIQVYFIDNDDYFQKAATDADAFGNNRADNDERIIFFTRGMMETARKLQWAPDVMQLSGWYSALVPLYTKRLFADSPWFDKTPVVYTILSGDKRPDVIDPAFFAKLREDGVPADALTRFEDQPLDNRLFDRMAIAYADAVVFQGPDPDPELVKLCQDTGREFRLFEGEGDHADKYDELYKSLMHK